MSIEPSTLIFALINFFILLFCLKKFLYKPLFNMLDERAATIAKNVDDAEQARDEANALKAEYEASLKEAQTKAQEIIQNANKLGEETRAEIVAKAREEAARASEKAREEYNYYLAEVNITRQSVAGIFRIINGISPVGCSFETRAEYNFLSLLSNVYKESAKK